MVIEKFEKAHNKIKHKAFGKVTIRNKTKGSKDHEAVTGNDLEEQVKEDERKAEKEIEEIKAMKGGRVGHIWTIRKKVLGGERGMKEATAILNPETKKVATTKNEIKEVTLRYCKETLESNEPDEEFKTEIEAKRQRVKDLMSMKNGEFVATEETFKENLKKFQSSGKRSYDFLIKTGQQFQKTIFKMCQRMFKEEVSQNSFKTQRFI